MRITTTIDDTLREVPDAPDDVAQAVAASRNTLEHLRRRVDAEASTLNTTRVGRQLQRHGRYLRLLGDYQEALAAKNEAIDIWREYGRNRARFLCRLQRGLVYFEAGHSRRALEEAEDLGAALDDRTSVYRDFLQELLGKIRYRFGEHRVAIEHLETALEIRNRRGNQRHVERTRAIIETVREGGER